MDSFTFQHAKEPFAGSIITTVANSAHTTYQTMLLEQFLVVATGKLTAPV